MHVYIDLAAYVLGVSLIFSFVPIRLCFVLRFESFHCNAPAEMGIAEPFWRLSLNFLFKPF
jgi:hypothetical protein